MASEDVYIVKAGDNLTKIAKNHGFGNPGPIFSYPPNKTLFRNRSPDAIRPGEKIRIPYHPDLLKKIIATSKYLASELASETTKIMREQDIHKDVLEKFLIKIDAANMLANVGVGLGGLIAKGPGATMTSKEAVSWLVSSRANVASNVATLSIPTPTAPKKDFNFFVRHTLGPWNPSFWASVHSAISEGDVDIYLYGADATTQKTKQKIKQQAEKDIAKLRTRWSDAEGQLKQPYYRARI